EGLILSPNSASLATVHQFQSETEAIRQAPEPVGVRVTLYLLVGFIAILLAIMFLMRMDRIIASVGGKIVPLDQINVIQALDPSIFKSINIHEGDEVKTGRLLATLDPTLTAADLTQYKA